MNRIHLMGMAKPRVPAWGRRLAAALRLQSWFPHLVLALGLAFAGLLVLGVAYGTHLTALRTNFPADVLATRPASIPFLLIGVALLLMSIGVALRSRLAWVIALTLTVSTILAVRLLPHGPVPVLPSYAVLLLLALLLTHRTFDRSSVAAGTVFALTSSLLLLIYAVFGSLYLGTQFSPPIRDLSTAVYFAIVTMGTVGYGDIAPHTPHARFFTISIIILGITVFATSLTAIIGPLVIGGLNRIVNRKERRMNLSDHFVIVGMNSLASNTYREFKRRHLPVVVITPQPPPEGDFEAADVIVGDANSSEILCKANAREARAVLALRADDSENAFIVLAVKELKGRAQTVVAVNDSKHMARIKLVQPDLIIAPQVLGGEILAMALSGEDVTGDFLLQRILNFDNSGASRP